MNIKPITVTVGDSYITDINGIVPPANLSWLQLIIDMTNLLPTFWLALQVNKLGDGVLWDTYNRNNYDGPYVNRKVIPNRTITDLDYYCALPFKTDGIMRVRLWLNSTVQWDSSGGTLIFG